MGGVGLWSDFLCAGKLFRVLKGAPVPACGWRGKIKAQLLYDQGKPNGRPCARCTVETRKLEHRYSHAPKVKYRES